MANLTSVYGTVTLTAKTKDDIVDLLYLHALSEKDTSYDTTIAEHYDSDPTFENYESIENDIDNYGMDIEETDDSYTITFHFTATGRNAFENNINWFFNCLTTDFDDDAILALQKNLKPQTIDLTFDYNEHDSANEWLIEQEIDLHYEDGDVIMVTQHTEEYDYTVENLILLDIYETGDIISEHWLKDNYDRYMNQYKRSDPNYYQFLKAHKKDIQPYLTDSDTIYMENELEELLQNNDAITLKEINYA